MPGDESELHVQKQKNASWTTELEMNGIDLGGGISHHLGRGISHHLMHISQ